MIEAIRVVVITDRRLCAADAIATRVAAILAHAPRGTVAIQVREKDLDGGPLLGLVRDVLAIARPAGAPVFVNDRLDVALVAGADGVHLPEHGLSLDDARATTHAVGPRALAIGCSRHTPTSVIAAARAGAALVQYGPAWAVPGKGAPIGSAAFAVRAQLPPSARLVAVGGIDSVARARDVARAGADAVAVIRAAWQSAPDVVARLVEAVDAGHVARSALHG